jgi:hypothetical protein
MNAISPYAGLAADLIAGLGFLIPCQEIAGKPESLALPRGLGEHVVRLVRQFCLVICVIDQ